MGLGVLCRLHGCGRAHAARHRLLAPGPARPAAHVRDGRARRGRRARHPRGDRVDARSPPRCAPRGRRRLLDGKERQSPHRARCRDARVGGATRSPRASRDARRTPIVAFQKAMSVSSSSPRHPKESARRTMLARSIAWPNGVTVARPRPSSGSLSRDRPEATCSSPRGPRESRADARSRRLPRSSRRGERARRAPLDLSLARRHRSRARSPRGARGLGARTHDRQPRQCLGRARRVARRVARRGKQVARWAGGASWRVTRWGDATRRADDLC